MGGLKRITHEIVSNHESLRMVLNDMAYTFEEIRALLNEVKADSVANKAALDVCWAAIIADRDDSNIMLEKLELEQNNKRAWEMYDRVVGDVNLRQDGTDATRFTTDGFSVMNGGTRYLVTAVLFGTGQDFTAAHNIGAAGVDWGYILFVADRNGAITTLVNTTPQIQDNLFAACMLPVTIAAGLVPVGCIQLQTVDGNVFVGQTDDLDVGHANVNAIYFRSFQGKMGILIAADDFAISGAGAATFDVGAGEVVGPEGYNDYTALVNNTFTLADTINTAAAGGEHWGGWLVLIDSADAIFTLKADNVVVQGDMDYADQPTAQAALDALRAIIYKQSPDYQIIGQILVRPQDGADWVANTDDLDHAGTDALEVYITAYGSDFCYLPVTGAAAGGKDTYGAVGPSEQITDTGGVTAAAPTIAEATQGDIAQRTQRTV